MVICAVMVHAAAAVKTSFGRAFLAVACWSLLHRVAPVHAADGPRLTWDVPAGCPAEAELRAGVEQLLRRSWSELDPELEIQARVSEGPDAWRLELELHQGPSGGGTRRVEGESCAALVEAASAIIALAIDAKMEALSEDAPPTEQSAGALPAVAPAPADPRGADPVASRDATKSEVPRGARPRGMMEAALLVDGRSLPRASPGLSLAGGIQVRRWGVSLGAFGLSPVRTALGRSGTSAELWLAGGQLRGCHQLSIGRLGVSPCGLLEGGWIQGHSRNVSREGSGGSRWWSAGPELRLVLPLAGGHALLVGGSAQAPLRRDKFVIGPDNTVVHEIPPVVFRGILGWAHFRGDGSGS